MKKQYLEAGRIVNTHGVRGEVKIEPWADDASFLTRFKRFYLDGKAVKVLSIRVHKTMCIAALEGIDDVNAAMTLKGKVIFIDRDDAKLPAGAVFIQDILGARVVDEAGTELGVLEEVIPEPSASVYVVRGVNSRRFGMETMRIDILTLFPDAVNAMMSSSILGRGAKKGAIEINCVQIRDFTTNRQQQVDDYPYGGGWGCVMMAQPLKSCLDHVIAQAGERKRRVIYMSPQGKRFDQSEARRLVTDYDHLVLVCGHYEGVDERFIQLCCDEEMSIGDYVLTGGEIPAMAIADSVCRMVPGVLSDPECYIGESHWDGLLEYPQYTRPDVWEGMEVPEVLRSGNHADVAAWRREQQLVRTRDKRPDLFEAFEPRTKEDAEAVRRLSGRERLSFDCHRAELQDMADLMLIADEAGGGDAAAGGGPDHGSRLLQHPGGHQRGQPEHAAPAGASRLHPLRLPPYHRQRGRGRY